MPWTETTRREYRCDELRYSSDLRDQEWAVILPFLPQANRLGTTDLLEVVNAILYMAATGCQWCNLPKDFPPRSTVQLYFYRWRDDGLWQRTNHRLVMVEREREGREASPSAGVIDTQSVKTTDSGGIAGLDAGKKIKGRKRHILTDTIGLLVARIGEWMIEMVKRSDVTKSFEVIPWRGEKCGGEARLEGGKYGKMAFRARSTYQSKAPGRLLKGKPLQRRRNLNMFAMDLKAIQEMLVLWGEGYYGNN